MVVVNAVVAVVVVVVVTVVLLLAVVVVLVVVVVGVVWAVVVVVVVAVAATVGLKSACPVVRPPGHLHDGRQRSVWSHTSCPLASRRKPPHTCHHLERRMHWSTSSSSQWGGWPVATQHMQQAAHD
jgi:hypothetical protein